MLHYRQYNEERKNLVIIPVCGLGNRVLGMISAAYAVAMRAHKQVYVLWFRDFECNINVSDIIETNINVLYNTAQYDNYAITADNYIPGVKNHQQLFADHEYSKLCYLYPTDRTPEIAEWAKHNISRYFKFKDHLNPQIDFDDDIIGIHCRRADWGVQIAGNLLLDEDKAMQHMELDCQFADEIEKENRRKIFLSTDSPYTLAYFKRRFGKKLLYNSKKHYNQFTNRSELSIYEAATDMLSLSKCSMIYRDSNSTFSLAACILGNKPLMTWSRTLMLECGGGAIIRPDRVYHL